MQRLGLFKKLPFWVPPPTQSPFVPYDERLGKVRRSKVTTGAIKRDVLEYAKVPKDNIDDVAFKRAVDQVARDFSLGYKVRPKKISSVFDLTSEQTDIWSASPGFPFKQYGFRTKGEVRDHPRSRASIEKFWGLVRIGEKMKAPPCEALARSHLVKDSDPDKVRAVWMYPMTMIVGEMSLGHNLLKAYKDGFTPLAYGYETGRGGMRRLNSEIKRYQHFACIDLKKMDKTVLSRLIQTAFQILERNLDFSGYDDGSDAKPGYLMRMWGYMIKYFIKTPIYLPSGEMYRKLHGIPSGSFFTNLIGSIVNALFINYVYFRILGRKPLYYRVLGDDSVVGDDYLISIAAINRCASDMGLIINMEKSIITSNSNEVTFLGFKNYGGRPIKTFASLMQSAAFPERPDRDYSHAAIRVLALHYCNLGENLQYAEFCFQFCSKVDMKIEDLGRNYMKMLNILNIDVEPVMPKWDHFLKWLF